MTEQERKDEWTITISRRTFRAAFYIGVAVLAIYAIRTHNENVMWRETAGRILSTTHPY